MPLFFCIRTLSEQIIKQGKIYILVSFYFNDKSATGFCRSYTMRGIFHNYGLATTYFQRIKSFQVNFRMRLRVNNFIVADYNIKKIIFLTQIFGTRHKFPLEIKDFQCVENLMILNTSEI